MKNEPKKISPREMRSIQGGAYGVLGLIAYVLTASETKKENTKSMGSTGYCEQSDGTRDTCSTTECTMTPEEIDARTG